MATMIDSVTPAAIPRGTPVVAGYVDGPYGPDDPFGSGWTAAAWTTFSGSELVTITIYGAAGARVYDIEKGDGTPASGAAWCKSEIVAGRRPTLYFSTSLLPTIEAELAAVGVAVSQVDFWGANYNDEAVVPQGYVAHQYLQDQPGVQGSYIDYSVTNNVWPASAPAPKPSPPKPSEVPQMYCTDPTSGKVWATTPNGAFYAEAGIPSLGICTLAQHPTWKAGEAESAGANPCVGITPWLNDVPSSPAEGKWGYCYITQPTSGAGGFGIYNLYHVGRDGTPH